MKSLTLLWCVLAVLGALASATFYIRETSARRALKQQVTDANGRALVAATTAQAREADKTALTKRLTELDAEIGGAKSRATMAETKAVQAAREAAQLRKQLADAPAVEQELTRQLAAVQRELADARMAPSAAPGSLTPTEATALRERLETLQAQLAAARATPTAPPVVVAVPPAPTAAPNTEELNRLRETITRLESDLTAARQRPAPTVTPPAVLVAAAPSPTPTPPPALVQAPAARRPEPTQSPRPTAAPVVPPVPSEPQVVSIGAGNAFVVINYGGPQGARPEQTVQISREGQPLALAKISEIRGRYAVAQIVPDSLRGALRKGDSVAMLGP